MNSKGVVLAGDKRWVRLPDAHHRHLHPAGLVISLFLTLFMWSPGLSLSAPWDIG